jgi:hypothetical protein
MVHVDVDVTLDGAMDVRNGACGCGRDVGKVQKSSSKPGVVVVVLKSPEGTVGD